MSLKKFTTKYLFENDQTNVDINIWLNMEFNHRLAFVNMLFFMDNRTEEILYKDGIKIKVIRTRKLDIGFLMLTTYKGSAEENEVVINFLNNNQSYWAVDEDKIKLNSNLILDQRKNDVDRLAKYFEVKKSEIFY
jgi:hypothetical protein